MHQRIIRPVLFKQRIWPSFIYNGNRYKTDDFTTRLNKLKAKYDNALANAIVEDDDRFDKKLMDAFFKSDDIRLLPYSGISTLLDSPYSEDLASTDIALIGIPMDLGVTNRPGARFGPRAVRTIERVGPYNHQLKIAPHLNKRVNDVGDVPFRSRYDLPSSIEDIETFIKKVIASGAKPLSVGGDHSVTYPILKAVGAKEPVALIHFDAHCDTCGPFEGAKFHHGGPFRLAALDGVIDPHKTIQIGIRGSSEIVWGFSYDSGMTVIHIEDIIKNGCDWVVSQARKVVGDSPVYISFDVDCLDPSIAPGTGTPEVGGLTSREAQQMLRALNGLNVIGGDVVEVAPQYDSTTNTALVGAQILFEILCLMANPSIK